jgi:hypothetical protein
MRQQACWFHCDTKDCDEESAHEVNFSDARRSATAAGWVIHPSSGDNQKHLGPVCVAKMMDSLVAGPAPAPVLDPPDGKTPAAAAPALDETPF